MATGRFPSPLLSREEQPRGRRRWAGEIPLSAPPAEAPGSSHPRRPTPGRDASEGGGGAADPRGEGQGRGWGVMLLEV